MKIIVGLNSKEKRRLTAHGKPFHDLHAILSEIEGVKHVDVYGKGRYANVEISKNGFAVLKRKAGGICNFSPVLDVHPFKLAMK